MRTVVIIPARLKSTRLPDKLILAQSGKPLIQHTWEKACQIAGISEVIVGVDDPVLHETVRGFGGHSVMTRPDHTSGSARVAEVAQTIKADTIINLQADEPEIDPGAISALIDTHQKSNAFASTLVCPFPKQHPTEGPSSSPSSSQAVWATLDDPAAVKAVLTNPNDNGVRYALYFSRAVLPYQQDTNAGDGVTSPAYLHIGVYAFSSDSLQRFAKAPQSTLERSENLEQLRILEMGERIAVHEIKAAMPGIDTHADYEAFLGRMKNSS